MLQEKRMVAILPSNPKHCPKCGSGLIEGDFPVAVFEDGNKWHDVEINFFCPACEVEWKPEQIPDHPLYEPEDTIDPTECPHCGAHARREIDVEPHKNYWVYVYACTKCGKIWNVRESR